MIMAILSPMIVKIKFCWKGETVQLFLFSHKPLVSTREGKKCVVKIDRVAAMRSNSPKSHGRTRRYKISRRNPEFQRHLIKQKTSVFPDSHWTERNKNIKRGRREVSVWQMRFFAGRKQEKMQITSDLKPVSWYEKICNPSERLFPQ